MLFLSHTYWCFRFTPGWLFKKTITKILLRGPYMLPGTEPWSAGCKMNKCLMCCTITELKEAHTLWGKYSKGRKVFNISVLRVFIVKEGIPIYYSPACDFILNWNCAVSKDDLVKCSRPASELKSEFKEAGLLEDILRATHVWETGHKGVWDKENAIQSRNLPCWITPHIQNFLKSEIIAY